jgi:hypothetical protein
MAIVSISSANPGVVLGHRGPLLVSCFTGWPSGAALKEVAQAQRQLATQFGKVISLTIIPPVDLKVTPQLNLEREDRDASLEAGAAIGEQVSAITIASAMVILPRGVVAVMVNSFMAAMTLLMRSQTPFKTFRNLPDAVVWLEQQPRAPTMPGVVRDIEVWLGLSQPSSTGTR